MYKVCHLTSVHNRYDPRILLKECTSLADNDFDVTLIVANGLKDEVFKKVKIIDVGKPKSRFYRFFITTFKIYKKVNNINPDIYHFHDPELIPLGLILRLKGKKVIYDIHEDYYTSIKQKKYLHKSISIFLAWLTLMLERMGALFFYQIIAEKYYIKRFPKAIEVLNYPIIDQGEVIDIKMSEADFNLIYTGNVTTDRGALNHANIIKLNPKVSVYFIGKCSPLLSNKIQNENLDKERLKFEGIGSYVPFEKIKNYYNERTWLAALAIFPRSDHYYEKELTKFFEYMYFGIPIICSNFPVWKELIENNKIGKCVNPDDEHEIKNAIEWFINNPDKRREMGNRGHMLAIEKFNWDNQIDKLLKLYNKIVNND